MLPTKSVGSLEVGDVISSAHFAHAYYDSEAKEPFLPNISFAGKPYHRSRGQWPDGHPANDPERAEIWYVVTEATRVVPGWKGGDYIRHDTMTLVAVGLNGMLQPDEDLRGRIRIHIRVDKGDPSVTYWGRMNDERTAITYAIER